MIFLLLPLQMVLPSSCANAHPLQMSGRETEISFGNFKESSHGKILQKIGSILDNSSTTSKDDCLINCIENTRCLSVNIITLDHSSYQCELLSWSGTSFGQYLVPRANSWYYQLMTVCSEANPCQNGADCITHGGGSNYTCSCDAKFFGRNCENNCTQVLFDFEAGNLQGWTLTGTAFQNQPTYGDNPVARMRETANQKGNWWIGGYENRPSISHTPGETQGDEPTGTMTSPAFVIRGGKITFLIGGGTDINTERLELLVGGVVVRKETSNANYETMNQKEMLVSAYKGQSAQLRLVDESTVPWGHINVDHIAEERCP